MGWWGCEGGEGGLGFTWMQGLGFAPLGLGRGGRELAVVVKSCKLASMGGRLKGLHSLGLKIYSPGLLLFLGLFRVGEKVNNFLIRYWASA